MIDVAQAALTVAGTLVASHYAGPAWTWLNTRRPKLADQLRSIETNAQQVLAPIEKELTMVSDVVQQKLSAVGAAIVRYKTAAENAEAALVAERAEKDALNAHVADLTAQLAAKAQDLADTEAAVAAAADQAGA